MNSFGLIALAVCGVVCVGETLKIYIFIILLYNNMMLLVAEPQNTYDGRDGPHVFGTPGNQVYIRGQNEGTYSVPGVGGQFENAPRRGEHVYTDELGNTFVNRKNAGGPGIVQNLYRVLKLILITEKSTILASHSISGPSFSAQNLKLSTFSN